MAYALFFQLTVILSSYLCMAAALKSIVHFPVNTTTTWTNNDTSISQTILFSDRSMARFILLKRKESDDVPDNGFGFGVCFYCNSLAAESCYLSIVLVEMSNGAISKSPPGVVWSANQNRSVGENATLNFSHGVLFLADADGSRVWSTNTSDKLVSGMRIYVNGNMVLFNQTNATVWQSFDHPTDTLLPGLIRSIDLFFQQLDKIQSIPLLVPQSESYLYMKLGEVSGLRLYGWKPRNGWKKFHTILHDRDNECWFPLKCGRYGVCRKEHVERCTCPVGVDGMDYFKTSNSEIPYHGCRQNTHLLVQGTSDQYHEVNFGNLAYFSYLYYSNETMTGINEESCKQACEQRPSCKASFFLSIESHTSQGLCFLPSEILSMIGNPLLREFYTSLHMKIQTRISSLQSSPSNPRKVVTLALFAGVLAILVFIIVCLLILKKKKSFGWKQQDHLKQVSDILIRFSYSELSIATARFSVTLGRGGFGAVFKGILGDGTIVAVKRLENFGQGIKEFLAEVDTIGQIHHINLVRLIGFCFEKRHRMLVYEYMSRGSLDKWIFHGNKDLLLDWKTRKNIVLDVAKGLAYLHEDCRQRIAHLDVKPHNILLNDNFNAKLSDFGMSKLISRDQSQVMTGIRGTLGYLAPEWQHSIITVKADIYSFGIVLLEVVSGRKNLDYSQPDSGIHLLNLLQKKSCKNQLMDIVDCQSEDMQQHVEEAVNMIRLGMWCLNEDYRRRPSMSLVVKILEGAIQLDQNMNHIFPSTVIPISNAEVSAISTAC